MNVKIQANTAVKMSSSRGSTGRGIAYMRSKNFCRNSFNKVEGVQI